LSTLNNNPLVTIIQYNSSLEEISNEEYDFDSPVFFDFAWQGVFGSERNNEEQLTVNIPMTENSLELAAKLNAHHWIGIGSQAEYGNLNKRITEEDKCKPTTLYGKAKVECCGLSEMLCSKYGI